MQTMSRQFLLTVFSLLLVIVGFAPRHVGAEISDEAKAKIDAALPREPIVAPEDERHLLIFSLCEGFVHSAIPYGEYAFSRLGEVTGAFTATISTDPAVFEPESLSRFDAILFNNTTGTLFTDPILRESLINFVYGGGGIVGVHAATDCFYDWPQFGEMMGGYFDGHPWNEEVTLRVEEPGHPIAKPLGEELVVADEIYQFRSPYSREIVRVLVSLDTEKTDMNKGGIRREDGDFPISWVRDYGQGRVFYCSLGHRHEIFWNSALLAHYLAGIQFALGDLQADATPSEPVALLDSDPSEAFIAAGNYRFGDSRLPLSIIERAVFAAVDSPAQRRGLEERLIELLKGEVTDEVKAFACRQLSLIGGEASALAVAALLKNERLSHMARFALERLDTPAADEILQESLTSLDGELRLGVISSLGQRGKREAIPALIELAEARDTDETTKIAIAAALGRLGGIEGHEALLSLTSQARTVQSAALLEACYQAMALCADTLIAEGNEQQAMRIYTRLHHPSMDSHHRLVGLRGLAHTDPMRTIPSLMSNINGPDGEMRQTSLQLIRTMPGEMVTQVVSIQLPDLPFRAQADLIAALADRGDVAALPAVTARVHSGNRRVSEAALRALGTIGDESSVSLLAQFAIKGSETARESLERMRGKGVDEAIADALNDADADGRALLIHTLGQRRALGAVDRLIEVAGRDVDSSVRQTAYSVIGRLGGLEHIEGCLRLLIASPHETESRAAADAIISISERSDDREAFAEPIAAALETTESPARREMFRVLAAVGGETALAAVRRAYSVLDGPDADAALRALAGWRDAGSAEELLSIVGSGREHHRDIAFKGYIDVVSLPSDRPASENVRLLQRLLGHARTPTQTRQVLEALASVPHPAVLEIGERHLDDAQLQDAAIDTIFAVAALIGPDHERRALAAVDQVRKHAPDDAQLRRRAGRIVDAIQRNRDFITAFVYAGPYTKPGAGAETLFDMELAPEREGFTGWREIPAEAILPPGRIDLNRIEAGTNCAGYLYTEIESPRRQEVRLQIGSDDGVKAFLNGKIVHSNMVFRGLTLNEDTVLVTLEPGLNRLLLKIVQGGGDWGASCRLRCPEGFAAEGVTVRKPALAPRPER